MADYVELLRGDLVEQFKDKPVIDAIVEAIGKQLNDVFRFYEDLRDKRGLHTSEGQQLDGIGDIVVLSREEAGALACVKESVYVLDDDGYRDYLIYKIWKNTNNCTYHDVIKAFRMFWPKPLYYAEDPENPATMLFDTGILKPEDHAEKLLSSPIIKAAGVGILIKATTESPVVEGYQAISPYFADTMEITPLPEIEPEFPLEEFHITPYLGRCMNVTELPDIEPEYHAEPIMLHMAGVHHSVTTTSLPPLQEFETVIPARAYERASAVFTSYTETKLPEIKEESL